MGINNGTWQLISGSYLPDCPHNLPFHSLPTSFSSLSVSNPLRFSLALTLLRVPSLHLFCLPRSPSLPPSLPPALSGPSVFQGHVRRVEEHIGVIVIAQVGQVSLHVAHRPGVVLSNPCSVTEPWLQSQLENRHTYSLELVHTTCTGVERMFTLKLKPQMFLAIKLKTVPQVDENELNPRFAYPKVSSWSCGLPAIRTNNPLQVHFLMHLWTALTPSTIFNVSKRWPFNFNFILAKRRDCTEGDLLSRLSGKWRSMWCDQQIPPFQCSVCWNRMAWGTTEVVKHWMFCLGKQQ